MIDDKMKQRLSAATPHLQKTIDLMSMANYLLHAKVDLNKVDEKLRKVENELRQYLRIVNGPANE